MGVFGGYCSDTHEPLAVNPSNALAVLDRSVRQDACRSAAAPWWTERARRAWRRDAPPRHAAVGVADRPLREAGRRKHCSDRAQRASEARSEGLVSGANETAGDERSESPGARDRSTPRAFDVLMSPSLPFSAPRIVLHQLLREQCILSPGSRCPV
jgi:hypothetical protein